MDYQTLGLTELQADVLAVLLEAGGEATAPTVVDILSRTQKVNRTSIYGVLNNLERRGLLFSNSGRSAVYSLKTTKPREIVTLLLDQRQQEVNEFTEKLHAAKSRQQQSMETNFYSLRSPTQVLDKLELMIKGIDQYLLLMANAPILQKIQPIVKQLDNKQQNKLYIIPTWSPDPTLDLDELIQSYRRLLSNQQVTDPLPIFDRIKPMMTSVLKDLADMQDFFSSGNAFAIALSPEEWMMVSYLLGDVPVVSGIYSRELIISLMLHILYFTIFEPRSNLEQQEIDTILRTKIITALNSFAKMISDH